MTEKKGDMATNTSKNPKKANLLDHHSIKHLLDESVSEVTFLYACVCFFVIYSIYWVDRTLIYDAFFFDWSVIVYS